MGETDTPCETDWRSHPHASLYALASLCEAPKEQTPEKEPKPEPDQAPSTSDYCVVADSSSNSIVSSIGDPNCVTDSSETTTMQDDETTMIVQAVVNRINQYSDTSLSRCLRTKRKQTEIGSSTATPSLKRLKSSPQSPMPLPSPMAIPTNLALNPIAVSRCAGTQWSNGTGHKNASTTTRRNTNATKKTIVPFVANTWLTEERSRNATNTKKKTILVPFVANKWWAKERRNTEKAKSAIRVVPFVADKWWAKK